MPVNQRGEPGPAGIENAQKKVEKQNFLIRTRVLEYDDVMNQLREIVPSRGVAKPESRRRLRPCSSESRSEGRARA